MTMKKLIIACLIAVGALGGGYVFLSQSAQSDAEEAIATIESTIEADIPNSDFAFGEVEVNIFDRAAKVSNLNFKVDGTTLLTADSLVFTGDDVTLKYAKLAGIEGSYKIDDEELTYEANSLVLGDVNIATVKTILEAIKSDPASVMSSLNSLSIGEFELIDMTLKGSLGGEEAVSVTGQISISGVKNGAVKSLSISGSVDDEKSLISGDPFNGDLTKLSVSGLRFVDLFEILILGKPATDQMAQAFGIDNVTIEGLKIDVAGSDTTVSLTNGSVKIADSVIKDFSLKGLELTDGTDIVKAGEVHFKGLDLSIDFTSETAVMQNAARLYGITDIGIKDAFFDDAGEELSIADISLSGVVIEDEIIVKGKTSIGGLRIPLLLISEMDTSVASQIGEFTGTDVFVVSLSSAIDFDTAKGSLGTEIDFGAEGFAKVKLLLELADLDVAKVKQANQATDIWETMQVWEEMFEYLSLTALKIEYADDQLADKVLADVPDINQLKMMSEMQIDMFLGQYPEQAKQLKTAISGFLEDKNGFKVSATAKNPVGLNELESLYISGGLTDSISFEFEGN